MRQLRKIRQGLGWSQAELSRRSGLNVSTIGLIESGRLKPYHGQLMKLAIALGITEDEADQLLEEAHNE